MTNLKIKGLLFSGLFALMALIGANAQAAVMDYSDTALKEAQAAGKTVVIGFHADWCPTCVKQKPALQSALAGDDMKDVVAFIVDFDKTKELRKQLKVSRQSTVVVFKGMQETARATGLTERDALHALIVKGMGAAKPATTGGM